MNRRMRDRLIHCFVCYAAIAAVAFPELHADTPSANSSDAASVVKLLADESIPREQRNSLVEARAAMDVELTEALVADLHDDIDLEYQRIPWIWLITLGAGHRDQPERILRLLDVALPKAEERLRDWQVVAIGGGLVHGLSEAGKSPKKRIGAIISNEPELKERLNRAVKMAYSTADNSSIKSDTRYDALRMIALDDASNREQFLAKYLAKDSPSQLQAGAIGSLTDIGSSQSTRLLLDALQYLSARNRKLAVKALLRDKSCSRELWEAIENGRVSMAWLSKDQAEALRRHSEPKSTETPNAENDEFALVGVSKSDVTPAYPIRLNGFGNRKSESEGVAQRIWTKALAIGEGKDIAVFMTLDNCGISAEFSAEVARRLENSAGLSRERLVIACSHTHCAPMLTGVLPNIFSQPIPVDQQATIDRYTRELADIIEKTALAAIADRKPSRLSWSKGRVGFAKNRRPQGGPVDHELSLLHVACAKGTTRAVLVNYACHCTTLFGEFNQIHGDWAGCAQAAIERDHPGAIALVSIGCGADANPEPRREPAFVERHGEEIAAEVRRLLQGGLSRLPTTITARREVIELPFDEIPGRHEWLRRTNDKSIQAAYHAKVQLDRLDRGKKLPQTLEYPVQTWCFGDRLAMVFLAGEVVVDYSLRIKREHDGERIWMTSYANEVPCYIASKRVLAEGGYEADRSMFYYDRPTRFRPEIEDRIVESVRRLLPLDFGRTANPAAPPSPTTGVTQPRKPHPTSGIANSESLLHIGNSHDGAGSAAVVSHGRPLAFTGQFFPVDATGKIFGTSIDEQLDSVLQHLCHSLRGSGCPTCVRLNLYGTSDAVISEAIRRVSAYFPRDQRPCITTVVTRLKLDGAMIAVDGIGAATDADRGTTQTRFDNVSVASHDSDIIYVSGQAERGAIADATEKTMASLERTLVAVGSKRSNILHLKAFLGPMPEQAAAMSTIRQFFGNDPIPPITVVEWISPMAVEIELVASAPLRSEGDRLSHLTPPGMTPSPVFSRVARVRGGTPTIFTAGLTARLGGSSLEQVNDVFAQLSDITRACGSNLESLAKATYYVTDEDVTKALGSVRHQIYNPSRPPTASKAKVSSVGILQRTIAVDMIAIGSP